MRRRFSAASLGKRSSWAHSFFSAIDQSPVGGRPVRTIATPPRGSNRRAAGLPERASARRRQALARACAPIAVNLLPGHLCGDLLPPGVGRGNRTSSLRVTAAASVLRQPGWERVLQQYQFDLALIPADVALAQLLKTRPDWRVAATDGKRILLVLRPTSVLLTRNPG